ncbi:MAG: hypothetical protein M0D55_02375 [Elusimicrobiota bacterium]|nr:MAG: hypothetical protein M0D55_02375 [Elusimicrobiota bacterium]
MPRAYQRPESGARDRDAERSDRGISKPKIAKSTEAAAAAAVPAAMPLKPPPVKVLRRKVDGVPDRVEISCRMLAADPGPECATSSNYLEIKLRCCPDGAVERCRPTRDGVVIVGRGCEPAP